MKENSQDLRFLLMAAAQPSKPVLNSVSVAGSGTVAVVSTSTPLLATSAFNEPSARGVKLIKAISKLPETKLGGVGGNPRAVKNAGVNAALSRFPAKLPLPPPKEKVPSLKVPVASRPRPESVMLRVPLAPIARIARVEVKLSEVLVSTSLPVSMGADTAVLPVMGSRVNPPELEGPENVNVSAIAGLLPKLKNIAIASKVPTRIGRI